MVEQHRPRDGVISRHQNRIKNNATNFRLRCFSFMQRRITLDQSGLTLIELLVVIAIIGILAALLFPVLAQSKRKAQQIQCVGNLHQQGLALQSFAANNHAYPSFFGGRNSGNSGSWKIQLEHGGFDISNPKTNFFEIGVWRCPAARWSDQVQTSDGVDYYSYNAFGVESRPSVLALNEGNGLGLHGKYVSKSELFSPVLESEVANPSEMIAIGDSFSGSLTFLREDLKILERLGFASSRHQGKANVVFCDGHVESPTLKFLFEDTSDAALSRWNRDHLPHREKLTP